ncbi:MAG: hypothetical protein ABH878_04585 [bacterium]
MRNAIFWIVAIIITLAASVYQHATGPTHPARGEARLGSVYIKYKLIRSHGGETDAPISIQATDTSINGVLVYKRYKLSEDWTEIPLQRKGDQLVANLPHQPSAGKLEYYLRLYHGNQMITVPPDRVLVIRFKGAVPAWALTPHIILMFAAMLFSTRAGLEALVKSGNPRKLAIWTAGLLFLGGMIGGPIVQKYAFGHFWTGIPYGWDLTDNKTLIAMIGWIIAVWAGRSGKSARAYVLAASLLLLLIFSIPHSMMGSELDYSTGKVITGE